MRKLLIAILLMPLLVYAAETPSQCDDVQEVARLVMEARQLGAPLAEKYSADHAYFVALDLAQRWYDQLEYTNTN